MHKPLLTILAVFLLFMLPASSLTTLTYEETEKIALDISTQDPDNDEIATAYSEPLDRQGEWQTTYGDAGIYRFNVSVSDGDLFDSEEMVLIVNRKEEAPSIRSFRPLPTAIAVDEGKSLAFSIKGFDLNKDALEYFWVLDGKNISQGDGFAYAPDFKSQGEHRIEARITDGFLTTVKAWDIEVRDINVDALVMDRITDSTFSEGDLVRLSLPDFRYYGLDFTLSSPLEKNFWRTDYNSSGLYRVSVHAFGKGFDEAKTIRLVIRNVDRAPVFSPVAPQFAKEGSPFALSIQVADPDGDKISTFIDNPPEGVEFSGNELGWTPGYDEVQKDGAITGFSKRFHALSKVVLLEIGATANNLTVIQKIPLTILDVNRQPKLDPISPITAREGDTLSIEANANDPDNDALSYSYDGSLKAAKPIGFGSEGVHMMRVTASDGFLEDSLYVLVTVLDTNRPPVLEAKKMIYAKENEALSIPLLASDPDNDPLAISLLFAPEGMAIDGNTLSWLAPYSNAPKVYTAGILVSDGKSTANASLQIEVSHKNRAPQINGESPQRLSAKVGIPITLSANASDPDGDSLRYEWHFGLFDEYSGAASHQRTYSSPGEKSATVKISDGDLSTERKFVITVQ